ncbi:MAG: phage tail tape measure protein [Anaerolineae bacterium]|nr:phage tail tape measure protein [Anaerolineae bacterium]
MPIQLGSAYGQVVIDGQGVKKGLGDAVATMGHLSNTLSFVGGIIDRGVIQPLMSIGKEVVGVASEFQSQVAVMQIAARGATDELAAMNMGLKDLHDVAMTVGSDTALIGVSASASAEAMTGLYKAGLSTTEIFGDLQGYMAGTAELGGALRASIDLAAATELDMVQASELASVALASFGAELTTDQERAEFVTAAMNNFVQAADASVAEVTGLAEALSTVGPTAASFGFTLQDTNNALAILSTRGIQGSEAGNALKSMFTNMMRDTPKVKEALAELNITLYDQEGQMRSLPNIVAQLSTAMDGMTEAQRNQYVQTLAGTYGMKAMQTLLAEGVEGWDEMARSTENAATIQEQAAAKADTFAGALESAQGVGEALKITFGEGLLPVLTDVLRTVATVGESLMPMVASIAKGIGTIGQQAFAVIKSFVGSFAQAIGIDFSALQANASGWGSNIVLSLARGMASAVAAVVQVLRALGNLIAGFLRPGSPPKLLPNLDKWGADAATLYFESWGKGDFGVFDELTSTISDYLRSMGEEAMPKEQVLPWINTFKAGIAEAVSSLREMGTAGTAAINDLIDSAEFLPESMKAYATALIETQFAQEELDAAMETMETIADASRVELEALLASTEALPAPFADYAQALLDVEYAQDAVNAAMETMETIADANRAELEALLASAEALPAPFADYAQALLDVEYVQDAVNAAMEAMETIADASRAELEALLASAEELPAPFADYARALLDVEEAQDAVATAMANLEAASEATARAQEELNDVTAEYDAILSPLQQQMQELRDREKEIKDSQRLAEIEEELSDGKLSAAERELLMLERQEIQLRQQIEAVEDERDAAEEAAQAKLDAAKEAEAAARAEVEAKKEAQAAAEEAARAAQKAAQAEVEARREALEATKEAAEVAKEAAQDELEARREVLEAIQEQADLAKEAAQTEVDARREVLDAAQQQLDLQKRIIDEQIAANNAINQQAGLLEGLQESLAGVGEGIGAAMEGIAAAGPALGDAMETALSGLGDLDLGLDLGEALAVDEGTLTDVESLVAEIEGIFAPLGTEVAGLGTQWGGIFASLGKTLSTFQTKASGVAARLEPLWTLLRDNLEPVLVGVGAVIASLVVLSLISMAAAALPIVAPLVAIGAAAALIWAAWQNNWLGIRDTLTAIWTGTLQPALSALWSWLAVTIPQALAILQAWWTTNWPIIQAVFMTVWSVISSVVQAVVQTIVGTVWPQLQGAFTTLSNTLSSFGISWGTIWNAIVGAITIVAQVIGAILLGIVGVVVGIVNGIAAAVTTLVGAFTLVFNGIVDIVTGFMLFFTGAWEIIKGIFTLDWPLVVQGFQMLWQGLVLFIQGLIGTVIGLFQGLFLTLSNFVSAFIQGVIDFFTNLYNSLVGQSIIPDMVAAIQAFFQSMVDFIVALITMFITSLTTAWTTFAAWFTEMVSTALTTIQTIWSTIWNAIMVFMAETWSTIQINLQEGIEAVRLWIETKLDEIKLQWEAIWNVIMVFMAETWSTIQTNLQEGIEKVRLWIQTKLTEIKAKWTESWNAIKAFFSTLWANIITTLRTKLTEFINKVTSFFTDLKAKWNTQWDSLKTKVSGIWTSIKQSFTTWVSDAIGVGKSIVDGIKSGITQKAGELARKAASIVRSAIQAAKEAMGISSPSKYAADEVGEPTGEGMIGGAITAIQNARRQLAAAVQNMVARLPAINMPTLNLATAAMPALVTAPAAASRQAPWAGSAPGAGGRTLVVYGGLSVQAESPTDFWNQMQELLEA